MHLYERITECFDAVDNGEVGLAVVPLLNSTTDAAWVNETLKKLRDNGARIYGEHITPIRHNVAALPGTTLADILYVHSKDKALQQCSMTLGRLCPQACLVEEKSTAAAAKKLVELQDKSRAVVVTARAAQLYGLELLYADVQDNPENKTKFVVIGKEDHTPTGKDKTTLIFEFHKVRRPRLVYNVIKELAERDINLTYLQSVPKDGKLDEFTFYCDVEGHRLDARVAQALTSIERNPALSYWKVLGSYPAW